MAHAIARALYWKPVRVRSPCRTSTNLTTVMSSKFKDAPIFNRRAPDCRPWNGRLNVVFKTSAAVFSDRQASRLFRRDSVELLRLADDDESYDVFQILMIPRVIGIEDSSRNWSVMMVLEHLCLTNRDMLRIIKALVDGIVPRGEVDIAMYKPIARCRLRCAGSFHELTKDYIATIERLLESRGNLETSLVIVIPGLAV